MKKREYCVLFFIAACIGAVVFLPGFTGKAPKRIMPLGDSITYGIVGGMDGEKNFSGGYRAPLARKAEDAYWNVQFVGTQVDALRLHHEGYPGWRIDQIDSIVADKIRTAKPDIILLHIGTNDLAQGTSADIRARNFDTLLNTINAIPNPPLVLVSSIILICGAQTDLDNYNKQVETIVKEHVAKGEHFVFVDMNHESHMACDDLSDAVHPNREGYIKMADVWFKALKPYMN